jgi:hypothetical protein
MLISHSSLLLFVTGAALLLVIPGPAVTYVVSRSNFCKPPTASAGFCAFSFRASWSIRCGRFSLAPWPSASAPGAASVARSATFQEALSSPSVLPSPSPAPKRNDRSKRAGVRGKLLSCQSPLRNNSTSSAPAVKSSPKLSAPWPRGSRRASRPRS